MNLPAARDDIARALTRVLTDAQHAAAVADAALAASRRFDWTDSAARTWDALLQLGTTSRGRA